MGFRVASALVPSIDVFEYDLFPPLAHVVGQSIVKQREPGKCKSAASQPERKINLPYRMRLGVTFTICADLPDPAREF
jgi:hypothetical protein